VIGALTVIIATGLPLWAFAAFWLWLVGRLHLDLAVDGFKSAMVAAPVIPAISGVVNAVPRSAAW